LVAKGVGRYQSKVKNGVFLLTRSAGTGPHSGNKVSKRGNRIQGGVGGWTRNLYWMLEPSRRDQLRVKTADGEVIP